MARGFLGGFGIPPRMLFGTEYRAEHESLEAVLVEGDDVARIGPRGDLRQQDGPRSCLVQRLGLPALFGCVHAEVLRNLGPLSDLNLLSAVTWELVY